MHKANVTLKDALIGGDYQLRTLDNRKITIHFDGPISSGSTQIAAAEGMPISKTGGKQNGDLVLKFNVIMPSSLTAEQKLKLNEIL